MSAAPAATLGAPPPTRPAFPYAEHCGGRHPKTRYALEAQALTVRYPGGGEAALIDFNLQVPVGTRVALVGANGAGKSTLLRAAAGVLPLASGTLRVCGHAVGACRHQVAWLAQRSELNWDFPLSVERLVLGGRYVHLGWFRRPGAQDYQRVRQALQWLRIEHLADRPVDTLSGGQQQRALLARTLVHDADLLLLDEPLNAVDRETRAIVAEVLDRLRDQGRTVIVATHDLDRIEADFDAAVFLADGRIEEERSGAATE